MSHDQVTNFPGQITRHSLNAQVINVYETSFEIFVFNNEFTPRMIVMTINLNSINTQIKLLIKKLKCLLMKIFHELCYMKHSSLK